MPRAGLREPHVPPPDHAVGDVAVHRLAERLPEQLVHPARQAQVDAVVDRVGDLAEVERSPAGQQLALGTAVDLEDVGRGVRAWRHAARAYAMLLRFRRGADDPTKRDMTESIELARGHGALLAVVRGTPPLGLYEEAP